MESFLRFSMRLNLLVFRTIPELIIALLFIRVIGLGVNAGILSIVIVFTGFMSKVFKYQMNYPVFFDTKK